MKKIIERAKAPTPKFFKVLRNVALVITAITGTIATAPITLPAAVVSAAGYLSVAGSVAAGVSQLAKEDVKKVKRKDASTEQ